MKKLLLFLFFAFFALSWQGNAQTSTLYLTTSGGSYTTEKWVDITTGPDGTGTVIWAQGDGTYGNGAGLVSDASFTVTDGTTYYINCYDKYDDGWDGTKYEIRSASGGGGLLVANNGDVSPNDGNNEDSDGTWEDMDLERESSEAFSYTPPTCPPPSNQTASNIAATSADLGWTTGGASAWEIVVQAAGTGAPSGSGTATTSNPYHATGLSSGTNYEFYVRDFCDPDYSTWTGPFAFATACDVFSTPYSEDFEDGGDLDNCWTNETTDQLDWEAHSGGTPSSNTGPSGANGGTYYIYVETSGTSNSDQAVIYSPDIDLSGLTAPRLNFFYHMYGNGMDPDGSIDVAIDDGSGYTSIFNKQGNQGNQWNQGIVDLSAYNGVVSFKITGTISSSGTSYENDFAIDDFSVEESPSCPAPIEQTASNITATTADLGWTTGGASAWEIVVQAAGTGAPSGSGTATTSNPYNATGLTPSTNYEFYVRDFCDPDYSTWTGPFTFTTTPTNDDCANATAMNCGDNLTGESTNGATDNGDDTGCGMGKGVWYKYVAANIYELTVTATPVAGYDIELSVSSSSDCTTFTNLGCKDSGGSGGAETYTFTTSVGTTYYFYVAHYSNTSTVTGDFDIALSCVTCIDPSGQTEINITPTSADLDWTENGGASTWEIEWGLQGFSQGSGTMITGVSAKPYNLSGLTALTDYDWYVRSDCGGGDFSNWTGPHTFTTASADAVDWCNLQYPDAATITSGGSVDVYARVYEPGVTDAAGQGAGITAWIGYSATDSDPSTWTNWVAATYNVDAGNNDEYQAALGAGLEPGTYYYASRFKLNDGAYKYGGYSGDGGGFWDGATYVSGVLTINHIDGDLCTSAIALTVNDVCTSTTSSNAGATDSEETPASGCGSYNGADVWFSFVVPSTGHVIIDSDVGDITDGAMAAYSGTCGSLSLIECDDDDSDNGLMPMLDLTGLTPGETVYIRFWEYGGNVFGTFDICVQKGCPTNLVVLPAASSATTSTASCIDGDWTHYYDGTNILLSLNIGTSGAVITDVTVDPDGATNAEWYLNDADGFPSVAGEAGAAFMKRKWDVNASTQPSSDVGVRFYYTNDEFNAVNTVLTDNGGTALTGVNAMSFYKVTTTEDPFNISPGGIAQDDYVLIKHGAAAGIDAWVDGTYGTENYAEFNVAGFSGGGAGTGSAGLSIPIELLSFTGYADKEANVLNWTTLAEINTSMFYVERSEFGKEWAVVAKVEASGNSLSKNDYQVTDKEPVTKAFYRLRSVDRDGKYTISRVITIERKEIGLRLNSVYPNPNNGSFVVNLTSLPGEKGQIVLINALGIKVYTKDLNTNGGRTIERINVNQLPNGIYTLMLEQNNDVITKRVVINK